jgi:adenine deaminase
MNVPGVIKREEIIRDILLLSEIRDGHAPFLSGSLLDRYIEAGIQSDHETINYNEGLEKLQKGMYLYIREGSTEKNLKSLIPMVNACSSIRCCFCTDDRHTDMLVNSGHIDDCIRKAIDEGCETELAYRMATISPAERFRLNDRGALTPGRKADFSVMEDVKTCKIKRTYKNGNLILKDDYGQIQKSMIPDYPFFARVPEEKEIKIHETGQASIVQIQKGQISTKKIYADISVDQIPDIEQDILKVVVVSRYNRNNIGIGLVQGLGLQSGAIASSVSHDSHNIIASGVSDNEIITAIKSVVKYKGGMAINDGNQNEILPLELAGLMSLSSYEDVNKKIGIMNELALRCGAISDPFMYLSFLALTAIPEIRITSKGIYDVNSNSLVPLFKN